jgi:glycosyltransferase involved in cell wall biosynthesis
MRILQLHNRYQIVGGEEGVVQAEQTLLRSQGHAVHLLEVTNDDIHGVVGKAIAGINAVYSQSSKRKVLETLQQFQPDIVHVHNFFPLLSPSVYDACRSAGIPVIQTLHNYRLICPAATLFRDNQICEACIGKTIPLPGIQHGCYRESRSQSAVVAAMISWHRLQKTWQSRVDAYIALTEFQKGKLIEGGLPADKIFVKPNFVALTPTSHNLPCGNFALFVGRLSIEKGVHFLIEAYRQRSVKLPLKIVGDGPMRDRLEQEVKGAGLCDRITFLGRQDRETVLQLMQQAMCLVFPSIWYEGLPLTIVEAFACGLPVIVPKLGSMAEIVEDHKTGLQFVAGDAIDLVNQVESMQQQNELRSQLSLNCRLIYNDRYTANINYQQLMNIYEKAKN